MVQAAKEIEGLIDEAYVPSSVERKKAVLMYFFVGIVAALAKQQVSIYEFFHLKQSLGWRMIFFVAMMGSIIFIFIPYFRVVPVLFFVIFLAVRVIFVKQAWEGRYTVNENKILMPFFAALGGRVVSIFELNVFDPEDK